ncbi:MAG: D-alanine--D-alanine ligase [Halothiobacillaceae bacterium]
MNEATNRQRFGRVAVLMGGLSAEREISLRSGAMVHRALLEAGVDAVAVDVGQDIVTVLENGGFDRAFIALHGRGGEDGRIQALLEFLGIPYTGSGVLGSALGMDKLRSKLVWAGQGLPTPPWRLLERVEDAVEAVAALGLPLMIKPVLEGSSLGMSKVDHADEMPDAWRRAADYGPVMAEAWIAGSEYTVAILGERALPVIRLQTPHAFYDYEAKYEANDTRYLIPCGLPPREEGALQSIALEAFRAADCRGWGRVDLMVDRSGQPYLIEVNTVPGMTDHSLVPMAARADGLEMPALCVGILAGTLGEASS